MSRILTDLSRAPRPAHIPGSRVVLSRSEHDPLGRSFVIPENRVPLDRSEVALNSHEVRLRRAFRENPTRTSASARTRSRPLYRVQDQSPLLPRHLIVDRVTGVALARVRGDLAWVHNEALALVQGQGGTLADVKIVLEV